MMSALTPAMLRVLQGDWRIKQTIALLNLLQRAHGQSSTDPRDKVYRVLGISANTITVDYRLRSLQVFMITARRIILNTKRLYVIYELWSTPLLEGQPSWCPMWSHNGTLISFNVNNTIHEADAQSEAIFSFSDDDKTLLVTGCCIGTVLLLSKLYWEPNYSRTNLSDYKGDTICDWLKLVIESQGLENGDKEGENEMIEAFWRLLIGITKLNAERISPTFYQQLFDVVRGREPTHHDHSDPGTDTGERAYVLLSPRMETPKTETGGFKCMLHRLPPRQRE